MHHNLRYRGDVSRLSLTSISLSLSLSLSLSMRVDSHLSRVCSSIVKTASKPTTPRRHRYELLTSSSVIVSASFALGGTRVPSLNTTPLSPNPAAAGASIRIAHLDVGAVLPRLVRILRALELIHEAHGGFSPHLRLHIREVPEVL